MGPFLARQGTGQQSLAHMGNGIVGQEMAYWKFGH
jgi:hypothetical protein